MSLVGINLVEAELGELDNVEQRAQFGSDLLLADDRPPRFMRLAGVVGLTQRVITDETIAFTRKCVRTAAAKKAKLDVFLVVTPTPGHTIHTTARDEAADWLRQRLQSVTMFDYDADSGTLTEKQTISTLRTVSKSPATART